MGGHRHDLRKRDDDVRSQIWDLVLRNENDRRDERRLWDQFLKGLRDPAPSCDAQHALVPPQLDPIESTLKNRPNKSHAGTLKE